MNRTHAIVLSLLAVVFVTTAAEAQRLPTFYLFRKDSASFVVPKEKQADWKVVPSGRIETTTSDLTQRQNLIACDAIVRDFEANFSVHGSCSGGFFTWCARTFGSSGVALSLERATFAELVVSNEKQSLSPEEKH